MATVTNEGLNEIAAAIAGNAGSYIAIGTGTTAESNSDTQLVSESARAVATGSATANVATISGTITSTNADILIEEIGLFNGGSGTVNTGTLVARHKQRFDNRTATVTTPFDIRVGFIITVERAD